MTKSLLAPELINAYLATQFHVCATKSFILEIGKLSADLVALSETLGMASSTFITAYNPYSKALSAIENEVRNEQLKSEIKELGLTIVYGYGQDPLGKWDKEDSYLVFGLTLEEAKAVGNKYGQNAIVWCGADSIPQLILLR